jgi:hypothetical protein
MNTIQPLTKQQGIATLSRPRFKPGLLLEDEDLTAGVDYTRNMMRLMFRSLFGCGVVCGLEVEARLICQRRQLSVTVHKGVGLDCRGNPIEVPTAQTLAYDWDCKPPGWPIWVTLCYVEKCCRPKDVSCSIDGDASVVQTRSLDGFEIRLYDKRPECACSCQKPAVPPPTVGTACCDAHAEDAVTPEAAPAAVAVGAAGGATTTVVTPPTQCDCYRPQLEDPAPCGCDGDCACIVIGFLDKPKPDTPDAPTLDLTVRRFIRPVPAGFLPCIKPVAVPTENPAPDDDGNPV